MTDPELIAHLLAELTARFEYLAAEAAHLQDRNQLSAARVEWFCSQAEQANHLAASARILTLHEEAPDRAPNEPS